MYVYDFICTYKLIDEEFRDTLYQQQLLEAFNIREYDENVILEEKKIIYELLKDRLEFLQILEKVNEKYPQLCNTDYDALSILFSYDYFDLFHRYLIDIFINTNPDTEKHSVSIQSDTKQTDTKQTDTKQSDTKQTDTKHFTNIINALVKAK